MDKTSEDGQSCDQTMYAKQMGPVWWDLTLLNPCRDVRIFVSKALLGMVRIVYVSLCYISFYPQAMGRSVTPLVWHTV